MMQDQDLKHKDMHSLALITSSSLWKSFFWGPGLCVSSYVRGQRGRMFSASYSRSGGRGFDSWPCHVAVALGKQFTLTLPSPPTSAMGA
ncbi:hypothetical protein ElyMa_005894800 [Elysia marginata]|uniref:Uncharacterized protein n=1 Tax=Elysia marginata TaxID=1093978 RepID=A0AAV4G4T7_9GAST|nr:hypothetical protein ElyMa_005894800 [Elysia marginata]